MNKIVLSIITITAIATASIASETVSTQEESKSGFLDRFHFKGDVRIRHEEIEKENSDGKFRQRFRFRYNMNVDIMDNLLLETAVSTGKGSPTSGNVTFKDDERLFDYFPGTLKIDIADLKYSFGDSWVRVGKSKNKIYKPIKTQLVWDGDLRFEGVNYGYKDGTHQINLGVNQVNRIENHNTVDGDDINIFLAQYVNTMKLGDSSKLNLGAAYYYYDGVKGTTAPYNKNKFKGNSEDPVKTQNGEPVYAEDYGIAELFAEYKQKDIALGMPFKAALTLAYNTLASDENFAYDVSAELGIHKKFKVAATYRDVQIDSVFGAHSDSDFGGGGTNSNGYYVKGKYKFAKNVDIGAYFHWSKLGDDQGNDELDYQRMQLDLILKF